MEDSLPKPPSLRMPWAAAALALATLTACGPEAPERDAPDPMRYRLSDSGRSWRRAPGDPVLRDLRRRYRAFFDVVLDPGETRELDILALRHDLEAPGNRRERFDALNAVAVAYFELNARAQQSIESGSAGSYLADSFRSTKLLSIPWRAYGELADPMLREAVLDFYADIAAGGKRDSAKTAPRILRIVQSLEAKESDPGRIARIQALTARLESMDAEARASEQRGAQEPSRGGGGGRGWKERSP